MLVQVNLHILRRILAAVGFPERGAGKGYNNLGIPGIGLSDLYGGGGHKKSCSKGMEQLLVMYKDLLIEPGNL
jgi:hypothetical protein